MPDPPLSSLGILQAEILKSHLSNKQREPGYVPISAVYTSAMVRALHTTVVISPPGVTPTLWTDIHEVGGIWEYDPKTQMDLGYPGIFSKEILANFPQVNLQMQQDSSAVTEIGWYKKKFRESKEEAIVRARSVIQKLMEIAVQVYDETVDSGDNTSPKSAMAGSFNQSKASLEQSSHSARGIMLVTHGDFLELLLCELLFGSKNDERVEFCFNNASNTVVDLIVTKKKGGGRVITPRLIRLNDVSHFATTNPECITGGPVV